MSGLFVSALANAAILSIGAAGLLWLLLRIVPRRVINASTRYSAWWVALTITVTLPFVFARTPRPASLGSLPVQALAIAPELTSPQPSGRIRDIPPVNSAAAKPKAVSESEPPQKSARWNRSH